MSRKIYNFTNWFFGGVLCFILALLFCGEKIDYFCKKIFLLSNFKIFIISFVSIIFCFLLFHAVKKNLHNRLQSLDFSIDGLVAGLTILLFAGQCYICYNIFFLSGWDVGHIRDTAQFIANGEIVSEDYGFYYSVYPNNLLITYLSSVILKLNADAGIFTGDYAMMSGTVLTCLLNSLTCYLVYKTSNLFCSKRFALIAYLFAVFSFGISPWSVIFYSDSVGLIFPVLTYYLYVKTSSEKYLTYLKKLCAVLVAVIGYFIKPQCVIILIALMIYEAIKTFDHIKLKRAIKPLLLVVVCAIFYLTTSYVVTGIAPKVGINLNHERTLGFSHFFMMGLNEERNGVYLEEDVDFSKSFETSSERFKANFTKAFDRIDDMGFVGISKHICKKILTTFNDGSFAWGIEGTFYKIVPDCLNNKISPLLRSIFYSNGSNHNYFNLFVQAIWIVVLVFVLVSLLYKCRVGNKGNVFIIRVAILGLILYEILFEVRARYLYTYIPFFCILAGLGFYELYRFICKQWDSFICKGEK